ncbi:hypothetical protein G6F59_017216 [Rhizopus arrhizus]|nr:hypothetical protein G6F59_017216 [Rhizopus arrhizus]
MQRVDRVTRKRVEQAVLKHGARTAPALFGRLENQHGRAGEIARLRQVLRRPDQHRGVAVMTATVHQARLGGLVTEVVILGHGQGVHVGAQPDHAPAVAALAANHAHHAGLADAAMHLDAQRLKRAGHNPGGPDFLEAQFRMRMQIAPQRRQFVMK